MNLIDFEYDPSGFTDLTARLERSFPAELVAIAFDLGEEAERLVKESLTALIYGQPERGGYERTEELLRSAFGYGQMTGEGFDIVAGAVGGAEGREYARYVGQGTYSSRIDRDTILNDARAASDFAPRAYPRGGSGLEARPAVEPAIAQIERDLEARVFQALSLLTG